ncbi:MAG: ribonucleotide-diphosphate reductase subunit beta, partial [Chromatiales bacterium]
MLNWDDPLAPPLKPAPVPATKPKNETKPAHPQVVQEALKPAPAERDPEPVNPRDIKPVNPDDKRVINGMTDINQLAPFKYPWAWEYFLNANKNHWTPLDINMAQDVHDYHYKLTLEE